MEAIERFFSFEFSYYFIASPLFKILPLFDNICYFLSAYRRHSYARVTSDLTMFCKNLKNLLNSTMCLYVQNLIAVTQIHKGYARSFILNSVQGCTYQ